MMMTLWQLWGHFVITLGILGRRWGRPGVTLEALAAYGGDFCGTLGSLWGQFGVSLGIGE